MDLGDSPRGLDGEQPQGHTWSGAGLGNARRQSRAHAGQERPSQLDSSEPAQLSAPSLIIKNKSFLQKLKWVTMGVKHTGVKRIPPKITFLAFIPN